MHSDDHLVVQNWKIVLDFVAVALELRMDVVRFQKDLAIELSAKQGI
jgi:hypothetical protein